MKTTEFMDFLPQYCETCKEQGYYKCEDPEANSILACSRCGRKYSSVWCSKCGMGGDFVRNPENRPKAWDCPGCKERYELDPAIFDHSAPLIPESHLPHDIREQVTFKPTSWQIFQNRVDAFFSTLNKPLSYIFFSAFAFVLFLHASSIIFGTSSFPLVNILFGLVFIAIFVITDTHESSVSMRRYNEKYLKKIPILWKIVVGYFFVYSIVIYIYGWTVSRGRRLTELAPQERFSAEHSSLLCIQTMMISLFLFSGLLLWVRWSTTDE